MGRVGVTVSVGDSYGRYTVLREVVAKPTQFSGVKRRVECRCECGVVREVSLHHLRSGDSQSCGCLRVENIKKSNTTHGATAGWTKGKKFDPEYIVWAGIRARCKPGGHKDYSERGILMCDSWWEEYANFYADMGPRPSPDHSIDRIDNSKGYSKDNCRWATATEQARNTRRNRYISYNGNTMLYVDWCAYAGISKTTVRSRLIRGWTWFQALFTPIGSPKIEDAVTCVEVPRQ